MPYDFSCNAPTAGYLFFLAPRRLVKFYRVTALYHLSSAVSELLPPHVLV
jgi:hypothetical protein